MSDTIVNEKFLLIDALLPKQVEMYDNGGSGVDLQLGDNRIGFSIIDDNTYIINDKRITFVKKYSEVERNARVVSLILEELDGERRV